MLFVRLIRFLMGYVVFSAKGGFPERFINLCASNSVGLWNVKCKNNILTASTTIKAYRKIRKPAKRSGMLPRIKERHGLPFFMHRYRRRVGMLAGAAVAVFLLFLLSSMIWTINIEGNEAFDTEIFINVLEELGVKPGVRRNKIDVVEIKESILSRFPDLVWASLNINGSIATLEVREVVSPPEMFDINDPCNIIAAYDGEIIKLDAFVGEAAAVVGSAIKKGDLLISGISVSNTQTNYLHAKGEIIARTKRTVESAVEKNFSCNKISDEKIRYSISLFGIKIPLAFAFLEYDEYTKSASMLNSGENIFPIGILRERYAIYENTSVELSDKRAKLICFNEFYHKYRAVLEDAIILESELNIIKENERILLTAKYKAEESIGQEQYFEVENS